MSILTVAKGVYVIKPKLEGSRAADYMERYTKNIYAQTEMAMQQAMSEIKSSQDKYREEMELYRDRLKTLQAKQSTLEEQYRKQNWDVQEWNRKTEDSIDKERIAAQNRRDERRGTAKVAKTTTLGVKEAPPGKASTAAVAGTKLGASEQRAITQGLEFAGYDTDKIDEVLQGGRMDGKLGGSPEQIDAQRAYALETIKAKGGLTDQEIRDYTKPEILQSAARHSARVASATGGARPGGELQETSSTTRYEYFKPNAGIPRTVQSREFQPMPSVDVTQDPEYQRIASEIASLKIPQQEKIDLLERTRQLREERFGYRTPATSISRTDSILSQFSLLPEEQQAKLFESFQTFKKAQPVAPVPSPASLPAPQMETPRLTKEEATGKLEAIRAQREANKPFKVEEQKIPEKKMPNAAETLYQRLTDAQLILKDPKELEAKLKTDFGRVAQRIHTANSSSGKDFRDTYREISKLYADDLEKREQALTIALAYDLREKGKKSPSIQDTIQMPPPPKIERKQQSDMTEKVDSGPTE